MDEVGDESAAPEGGGEGKDLQPITARLHQLAAELEAEPDEEEAARLVREAADLAARAAGEVAAALRSASGVRDA
jgi:hypothetical protein